MPAKAMTTSQGTPNREPLPRNAKGIVVLKNGGVVADQTGNKNKVSGVCREGPARDILSSAPSASPGVLPETGEIDQQGDIEIANDFRSTQQGPSPTQLMMVSKAAWTAAAPSPIAIR